MIIRKIKGTGGVGEVFIQDEGLDIGKAKTLDFVGNDVVAYLDGEKIVVQVPPSSYAPLFNAPPSGGVADTPVQTRRVAAPTSEGNPYKVGDWNLNNNHPVTRTQVISYNTTGLFGMRNNSTFIKVEVLDILTPIAVNEIEIDGNKSETNEDITITITNFSPDNDRYKCSFSCSINLLNILPEGGRFGVRITHDNDGELRIKEQLNLFFDTSPIVPTINNPTFSENIPVVKKISGVNYYTTGSTFNVGLTNINNLNNRSFIQPFIEVGNTSPAFLQLNLSGLQLTGWDNSFDNVGASYSNSSWTINQPNNFFNGEIKALARWKNWINGDWQESLPLLSLIETYANNSTRIYEDFRNETRRLDSSLNTWDSNLVLTDGLQVLGSYLIYPQEDFTSHNPLGSPDYSVVTGTLTYYSHFFFTNVSKSNGIFQFGNHNITEDDITNETVKIEISVDKTNWFNVNQTYMDDYLSDGDGCRISPDIYNLSNSRIRFTLGIGLFTNAASEWGIWFKISISDNTKYIDSFQITDWV
jgi:hypothetical protein